ncbi:MAG: hypothetical protein ACOX6T_21385 [Myxococcales bacterium]|jgi:hypothetical protein
MDRGRASDLDALEGERAEVDQLFALPLERFTAARDKLSARLRREGKGQLATQVKALRKPTVPAWAVDQLARRRPEKMRALMRAGDALREAQERVLAGAGGEELHEASKRERALVSELTREAASILERAGFTPSPAHVEPVRATLTALASASEADRRLVARGWLSRPLSPARFDELLGEIPAPAPTSRKPSPTAARAPAAPARARPPARQREEERESLEEQARRRAERRRLVQQARRARELAAREAESAAREAEALEREAEALGKRAEELESEAERAERAARQARSEWEEARAGAAERRKAARESARRLDEARQSLEALERQER